VEAVVGILNKEKQENPMMLSKIENDMRVRYTGPRRRANYQRTISPGDLGTVAPYENDPDPNGDAGTWVKFDHCPSDCLLAPHGSLEPVVEAATPNIQALLDGCLVAGRDLSPEERKWLDGRRRTAGAFMSGVGHGSGMVPHRPADRSVDYYLDEHGYRDWWFALVRNPKVKPNPNPEEKSMKKAYFVCTEATALALAKELEALYPKLRWASGDRPAAWVHEMFRGVEGAAFLVLRNDAELTCCTFTSTSPDEQLRDLSRENLRLAQDIPECLALAKRVLGRPKPPVTTRIDYGWLVGQRACFGGLRWFAGTFGEKAEVERDVLRALASRADPTWATWLDEHP
jgi:hypothetical protein